MAKLSDDFILPLLHKEFSAATRDWTDAEVGAYTRLLIVQWDQGSIPEDITRLRKIADSIDQTKDLVLSKFKPCSDPGRLQNSTMELIREERKIFRAKKSDSGKKGASKRWQSDSKPNGKRYSKRMPFSNEVEVEVKVDNEIKVKEEAAMRKIPPSRFDAQQIFSINKPGHWTTEYMETEVDAWFDHYNANGWLVGKSKMKDWKATIRTWIRNDYNFKKEKNGNITITGDQKKPWRNGPEFDRIAEQLRQEAANRTQ